MLVTEIQARVAALNAAEPTKAKKRPVKKTTAAAAKTNGHTVLSQTEQLRMQAVRIAAAFNLGARGITVDELVRQTLEFESQPVPAPGPFPAAGGPPAVQ